MLVHSDHTIEELRRAEESSQKNSETWCQVSSGHTLSPCHTVSPLIACLPVTSGGRQNKNWRVARIHSLTLSTTASVAGYALHTIEQGLLTFLTLMRIILIQYLSGICPTFHGQFGSQASCLDSNIPIVFLQVGSYNTWIQFTSCELWLTTQNTNKLKSPFPENQFL